MPRKSRFHQPEWEPWVSKKFSPDGIQHLELIYAYLKEESGRERAGRISADDLASTVFALARLEQRNTLLRAE